ncbi:hypothetical protein V7x_14570 [Crateriforma conspicua]|uniref:Uncharacterized protein n=1 Tax=Crateriforma conspicua TaxID=2527996 RepID=A0A5C6FXZ5_9PLAN|nr:hypothetical protein V7x_14570 [Crateriforma conspicua]
MDDILRRNGFQRPNDNEIGIMKKTGTPTRVDDEQKTRKYRYYRPHWMHSPIG